MVAHHVLRQKSRNSLFWIFPKPAWQRRYRAVLRYMRGARFADRSAWRLAQNRVRSAGKEPQDLRIIGNHGNLHSDGHQAAIVRGLMQLAPEVPKSTGANMSKQPRSCDSKDRRRKTAGKRRAELLVQPARNKRRAMQPRLDRLGLQAGGPSPSTLIFFNARNEYGSECIGKLIDARSSTRPNFTSRHFAPDRCRPSRPENG